MQQGGGASGSCASQRVTQSNGSTIHIHLLTVQAQLVTAVGSLRHMQCYLVLACQEYMWIHPLGVKPMSSILYFVKSRSSMSILGHDVIYAGVSIQHNAHAKYAAAT